MNLIDLRSDTVTQPCAAMRQAMCDAEVGDDVLRHDPTVEKLEAATAEILGKEAAIYLPSGSMSNQVAIRCLTEPGDELILEANSHTYFYEGGAPAAISGVTCRLLPGQRGIFTVEDFKAALRPANMHFPRSKLLIIENTHNRGSGNVWPIEKIEQVAAAARDVGLKMHLDGARIWNASAASGIAEKEYAKYFDTVNVCFSKGLGAPVGSALAGTKEIIERARRFRKQFGGGMRQAGIIAAGALYGLQNNRARLTDDHDNAKRLAVGLDKIDGLKVEPKNVCTNIVMIGVNSMDPVKMVEILDGLGVLVLASGADTIRAVTNLHITAEDIDSAVSAFKEAVLEMQRT
jgi:threonine aldolase